MFNDFSEILKEFMKKLLSSRLVILAVVFVGLYAILGMRLFNLQIMEGEQYQENYMAKTEKKISLAGTRGNIYDRNGNLLAYNKLSYNVTLQDNGENVEGDFSVGYDSSGNMIFTTTSEAARKRFLSDYYGLKKTDELDDADGKYPSDVTAREVFDARVKYYGLDQLKDDNDNPIELTDEEALGIINIRYTMGLTAYRKYESTTIASDVSKETMTDVLENSANLKGVGIEESTIRVYNDSVYFAPIIGYIGKVWDDELEKLRETERPVSRRPWRRSFRERKVPRPCMWTVWDGSLRSLREQSRRQDMTST